MPTTAIVDTFKRPVISSPPRTHRRHSLDFKRSTSSARLQALDFKRSIVAQSYQPGVSVAGIARANGINANQVFAWRKLFREADRLPSNDPAPELLPVTIASTESCGTAPPAPEPSAARQQQPNISTLPPGILRLEFRACWLTIEGSPDAELLRTVLGCLSR